MLKILYTAGNNINSRIQLSRFLSAIKEKPFIVKIAAFKKSSPYNQNIDWTLDCLLNIYSPNAICYNSNYNIYFDQIKSFNPDLIISDMEYYTSHIAAALNIKLWQCSSLLINFALEKKYRYNLGCYKTYSSIMYKTSLHNQRFVNIIDNSHKKLLYSHFGDSFNIPSIKEEYEWIRPYYQLGKTSIPCQHNIVSGTLDSNKKILKALKDQNDCVSFTDFIDEYYPNIIIKNINNEEEYYCNLTNSRLFMCEGQTSFLADAFYNNRYAAVLCNLAEPECIINSYISEKIGLSYSINSLEYNLKSIVNLPISYKLNNKINFLHEKIEKEFLA